MTNIFHKKDGLTDAVKSVMEVNQFHREAEAQVNEMFGVVSRKALPHEQQASWDAEFNKIISEGAMKRMSMGDDGGMETYKKKPEGMKPKGMKMADKDYDGDGKIETSTDEWKGSRDKAIKKSMAMDEEEQIDEMDALDKKRMTSTAAQVNKAGKSDSAPEIRKAAGAMQRSRVNIDKASDRLDRGGEMSGPTPKKVAIEEKKLTDAEMAKREEIVKSMKKKAAGFEKRYPGRGKEVMYATATKQAKELAEESLDSIQEEIATNLYAELNYVMEQHGEEAGDEWIANLSEEQLAIMEGFMDYLKSKFGTQSMRKDVEKKYGGEKPTLSGSIGGSAARKAEKDRLAMGAREAGTYGKQYAKPKPKPTVSSVDPKTANAQSAANRAKADASRPTADMARKALNNKPTAPAAKAPAPAPVKKAKPTAPAPVKRVSNIKGGETAASYAKRSAQFGKERGGGR